MPKAAYEGKQCSIVRCFAENYHRRNVHFRSFIDIASNFSLAIINDLSWRRTRSIALAFPCRW